MTKENLSFARLNSATGTPPFSPILSASRTRSSPAERAADFTIGKTTPAARSAPFSRGEPPCSMRRERTRSASRNPTSGKAFRPIAKLEAAIHNCEFLGFLDGERKRVGCLLHPSVNAGDDLRNHCCFYGLELCAGHFCPSYTHLTLSEQKTVLASLSDWYLYGLVVTDVDLVKDFCIQAQTRLGDSLREERLRGERVLEALRDFFRLKESWKFASGGKRLGKYYFTQSEYRVARIEYEKNWKLKPSGMTGSLSASPPISARGKRCWRRNP